MFKVVGLPPNEPLVDKDFGTGGIVEVVVGVEVMVGVDVVAAAAPEGKLAWLNPPCRTCTMS